MRYIWDGYQQYLEEAGPVSRLALRLFSQSLRQWDALSAQRVDYFAANSHYVAGRIRKHYRRTSTVIHPPVDVAAFAPPGGNYPEPEDYYLYVGQLTAYKRADLAVQACARLGRPLLVMGEGPERQRLGRMAGPTVRFAGWQGSDALVRHMRRCRALLFPGEEDFGIVPVETLAAGRPVIAFGRGGALETVSHGETGLLFESQDLESLCAAIAEFESGRHGFSPDTLTRAAGRFAPERFKAEFTAFADKARKDFYSAGPPAGVLGEV
jgi:glycosyltransferase involved in cell wall biosynthesis